MTDRGSKKPPPAAAAAPARPAVRASDNDSTLVAARPDFTEDPSDDDVGDGIVFEDGDTDGRAQRTRPGRAPNTSDISLIDANESNPDSPRLVSFGEGAVLDDSYHPSTEVLKLAFSDPDSDSFPEEAAPVEVKKWKVGNPPASGGPAAAADRPRVAPPASARGQVFELPRDTTEASGEAVRPRGGGGGGPAASGAVTPPIAAPPPHVRGPVGDATRVEASPMGARAASLDVQELKLTLEEAEKLLWTVKSQLAGVDLGESRGTNAQLAAALHRLSEALDMLKK